MAAGAACYLQHVVQIQISLKGSAKAAAGRPKPSEQLRPLVPLKVFIIGSASITPCIDDFFVLGVSIDHVSLSASAWCHSLDELPVEDKTNLSRSILFPPPNEEVEIVLETLINWIKLERLLSPLDGAVHRIQMP